MHWGKRKKVFCVGIWISRWYREQVVKCRWYDSWTKLSNAPSNTWHCTLSAQLEWGTDIGWEVNNGEFSRRVHIQARTFFLALKALASEAVDPICFGRRLLRRDIYFRSTISVTWSRLLIEVPSIQSASIINLRSEMLHLGQTGLPDYCRLRLGKTV